MPNFILHVNQHIIKANNKESTNLQPPILVKNGKHGKSRQANIVDIYDKNNNRLGRLLYSRNKPLSCGAKVWLELDAKFVELKLLD